MITGFQRNGETGSEIGGLAAGVLNQAKVTSKLLIFSDKPYYLHPSNDR